MKNYLIIIMLILFFIIIYCDIIEKFNLEKFVDEEYLENFIDENYGVIERINIDFSKEIKSNTSLKEFNQRFNTNIKELPFQTALIGFDLDSEQKFFNYNNHEYKYLTCTLKYWMDYIHNALNKRKYYIILCYADGYKYDEINDIKWAVAFNTNHPIPHMFAFARRWDDKNTFLLPDPFYTCRGQHKKQFKEIDDANIKWSEKKNICIWRGYLDNGYATNFFDPSDKNNVNQRRYFVQLYKDNKLKNVDFQEVFTNITDQIKFKYLLDIDGYSNTWDATVWKLYSGSVLLKVKSTWKQWYYDELKEWVHYVPVENDFSDLNEQIEWCNNNESKCLEIIRNAKDFVVKYFDINFVNNRIIENTRIYFQLTNQ